MKYFLPIPTQSKACIKFPKFRRPYCIAPKELFFEAGTHKCHETGQLFLLADSMRLTSPEQNEPELIPYVEYGSRDVAFTPLYPYYRKSPQWIKDRWSLMHRAPGQWLVEEWGCFPQTCAEADPSKKYPDIEWNGDLITALLDKVPTISSEDHPVWQKHRRWERLKYPGDSRPYPPSFDDVDLNPPPPPPPRQISMEEFRRNIRNMVRRR